MQLDIVMKIVKWLFHYCSLLVIITIILNEKCFAQNYTQNFTRYCKITFPQKPHKKSNATDTVYSLKYQKDLYSIAIHSFRHDPDFTLDSGHLIELYSGFVNQLYESKKVKIISKNNVVINGLIGLDIKYKLMHSDTTYICYHRILYVNRTVYNYGFSTFNDSDKTVTDKRNDFINSFVITEEKQNLYQFYEVVDDENPLIAKLADLTVNILVLVLKIVVFGLIITGLIYLYKAIFK